MLSFRFKEDQIIWFALIGSLLIHGFILIFSGPTFIQRAQYSVQPTAQMVEVSIVQREDAKGSSQKLVILSVGPHAGHSLLFAKDLKIPLVSSVSAQKDIKLKQATHSISGVKVKANPDYYQNPSPEYPELAKQMRQEGLVMLAVDVDREGIPIQVEIKKSSGFRLLDQAALKAVRHWKFQPGRIGVFPVESEVRVPVRFRLEQ